MLDNRGRVVRSHIINVACQIQRFDFDSNLVLTRKLIIRIPPPLRLKPLPDTFRGFLKRKASPLGIITFPVSARLHSKSNRCI